MLKIIFRNRKLRRCYEESNRAIREWGPEVGRNYVRRIEQLLDSANLDDVRAQRSLNFHPLKGKRKDQYAINLDGQWRLHVKEGETRNSLIIWEVTNHYD